MPANTVPIFSRLGDIGIIESMTAANNTIDITTGTSYLAYTADATNGSYVQKIVVKANPANNSAASVVRVWLNNGATTGTSANSALYTEMALPATTTSATAPLPDFVIPLNIALPAGWRIYLTFGTAPGGSAEFTATTIAGKY